ncbi:unnamed protein product, partial [Didymodactylos carnosus]
VLLLLYTINDDNFAIIDFNTDDEDDIELIKLRYGTIKLCRFFSDMRYPQIKVKVFDSFFNQVYKECKNVEYNGNIVDLRYESGIEFCEAQNFHLTTSDCFDFDEKGLTKTISLLNYFFKDITFILQIFINIVQ